MKQRHFDFLKPRCPVCSLEKSENVSPLYVDSVIREKNGNLLEGILQCGNRTCRREYPVIDGIPILLSDLRTFVSQHIFEFLSREDLSPPLESILGDCCGPASVFDNMRSQLSIYGNSHFADKDPPGNSSEKRENSLVEMIQTALDSISRIPQGPMLDIGCAVGRGTFELARQCNEMVLGIDLNVSMLRLGQNVLQKRQVTYPRKRNGIVYDRVEFPIEFAHSDNVDFWACDGVTLPFAKEKFALVMALNTLDCVKTPLDFLAGISELLLPEGLCILACPYDWSQTATPLEGWIGGHSQRGKNKGASEPILTAILSDDSHPQRIKGLEFVEEISECPWRLRLHDRSVVEYQVHLVIAKSTKS